MVSVDELLIVLRIGSGLRFDERLPGFHLHGTDIVQSALHRGLGAFAIDAPVNTFTSIVVGPSLMLRYNNTGLSDTIAPYAQCGAGFVYTDGYRDASPACIKYGMDFNGAITVAR